MPNWDIAIIDSFGVVDFPLVVNHVDVLDSYSSIDTIITNAIFDRTINDDTLIKDVISYLYVGFHDIVLTEAVTVTDIPSSLGNFYRTLLDIPIIWDTPQIGWGKEIVDSLITSESVTAITGLLIVDWLRLSESLPVQWTTTKTVQETVLFQELVQVAKIFLDSLAETLTLTDSNIKALGLFVSEYMAGEDTIINNLYANKTASDSMVLSDLAEKGFGGDIADTLAMSDSLVGLWFLACVAQDIVNMTETIVPQSAVNAVVFSGISVADTLSSTAAWNKVIEDSFNLDIRIILDGEVYQCWVLNSDELYPSVYSGYDYNSYAELQGKVYGAKSDGISLLEGITDAGVAIQTGVRMNLYNMGSHLGKKVYAAYFGLSGSKPVLKVINENSEVTYYLINGKITDVSKGHEGKDWIFDLAKVDSLDFAEITPAILSR